MTDKELLERLALRLMSSKTRITDLERENAVLKRRLLESSKTIEAKKS